MLPLLNYDCLCLIFELLDLEDQISLAHTCTSLQFGVYLLWKDKCKEVNITKRQFEYLNKHREHFLEYMSNINDSVETLKLSGITSAHFSGLKFIQFPKVHTLCVNMHYSEEHCNNSLIIIKKIFPNVKSLEIYGGFTGAHLSTFEQLVELKLNCCEDLRTKYFQDIFSKLNLKKVSMLFYGYNTCYNEKINPLTLCKTLEELCIDDHHVVIILKDLLKMPALRKITCYTRDYMGYILDELTKKLSNALETMVFDDSFWSHDEHCGNVKKMKALRRLIFHGDDITDEQLSSIAVSLSNTLEEFYFLDDYLKKFVNFEGLLNVVRYCTNLKIFDLSGTNIDIGFVEEVVNILKEDKNKQPLIFRIHGTKITNDLLKPLKLPDNLKISFKKNQLELPGGRFFQCEWRTKAIENN